MTEKVHFFAFFGGAESVVVLVVALILFGSKRIPEFAKGIGQAIKVVAEALTTDNQTVEIYDPTVFRNSSQIGHKSGSEKAKMKNAIVRKLFFVAGGFVFGVLAYRLYNLVFLSSH
jgi:TatA/E family protein of Tat protein translocase